MTTKRRMVKIKERGPQQPVSVQPGSPKNLSQGGINEPGTIKRLSAVDSVFEGMLMSHQPEVAGLARRGQYTGTAPLFAQTLLERDTGAFMFRHELASVGLTTSEAAKLCEVRKEKMRDWLNGKKPIPTWSLNKLENEVRSRRPVIDFWTGLPVEKK